MKYSTIEPALDLNDPERGFEFASNSDGVLLSLVDWRNRHVRFAFETVFYFSCRFANGYQNLPEGEAIEVIDSPLIAAMRSDHTAGPGDHIHHYVIATNEDEWCEVVAASLTIRIQDATGEADKRTGYQHDGADGAAPHSSS